MSNSPAVLAERTWIVWMWLEGSSARSISQQTGASLSTVYRWVRRWQDEGSVATRPYHRRLKKVPWTAKREFAKIRKMYNPSTSANELRYHTSRSFSSDSHPVTVTQSTQSPTVDVHLQQHTVSDINQAQFYGYSHVVQQCVPQSVWPTSLCVYNKAIAKSQELKKSLD